VRISAPFQPGPWITTAYYATDYMSFPGGGGGVKWTNRGVDHPSPSFAEIKERGSYTYVPLRAIVACFLVNVAFLEI